MRTIRRSKKYEPIVDLLTKEKHSVAEMTVFPTMRELMCFLAVLGYEHASRHQLDKDILELESRPFSSNQSTLDIFYLLALSEKRDISVLRDENEEELVTIFEEYAEGGFQVLERLVQQSGITEGDSLILKCIEESLKRVEADISTTSVVF